MEEKRPINWKNMIFMGIPFVLVSVFGIFLTFRVNKPKVETEIQDWSRKEWTGECPPFYYRNKLKPPYDLGLKQSMIRFREEIDKPLRIPKRLNIESTWLPVREDQKVPKGKHLLVFQTAPPELQKEGKTCQKFDPENMRNSLGTLGMGVVLTKYTKDPWHLLQAGVYMCTQKYQTACAIRGKADVQKLCNYGKPGMRDFILHESLHPVIGPDHPRWGSPGILAKGVSSGLITKQVLRLIDHVMVKPCESKIRH